MDKYSYLLLHAKNIIINGFPRLYLTQFNDSDNGLWPQKRDISKAAEKQKRGGVKMGRENLNCVSTQNKVSCVDPGNSRIDTTSIVDLN